MKMFIQHLKPGNKVIIGNQTVYLRKIIYGRTGDKNDYKFCYHNPFEQPFNNSTDIEVSVSPNSQLQLEVVV